MKTAEEKKGNVIFISSILSRTSTFTCSIGYFIFSKYFRYLQSYLSKQPYIKPKKVKLLVKASHGIGDQLQCNV